MESSSRCLLFVTAFFVLLTLPVDGRAQSAAANGTISGSVTDPQGAALTGAKVTVRNADFANSRTAITDASGEFQFALLPSGTYAMQVSAPGFSLKKPPRVVLGIGSSFRVTLRMEVASASVEVTVTGGGATAEGNTLPPEVNKEESEVSNTIAGMNVTYLPSRARDVNQLGELAAGSNADNANSTAIVIAGQRATALNAAVDGSTLRDPLQGGLRGAEDQSLFLPQTVVKEFQIVHSGAAAEIGDTNAGFLNITTKAGSNKLHGEAFYIGRPSALTSKDAFGHSLDNTQNLFGGSFGGPIKKDKAFYYFGIEQDYMRNPYWTEFAPQAPGVAVPTALTGNEQQIPGKSSPTALFGRTDFNLNPANTLNFELNYNHVHVTDMGDGSTRSLVTIANGESLRGDSVWARANLTSSLNAAIVNQLLLQWAQDHRSFDPNSTSPEIVINGFGVLGGNSLYPSRYSSQQFQLNEDVAVIHGSHLLHLGANFANAPARQQQEANLNGRFDFNSLADYLAGRIRRYQQTFATGKGIYDATVRSAGMYVSDRWSLSKQLTVTAGVRWDGQWNPQFVQTTRIPNDLGQWQPRLGLAWNPGAKTVIRLSSGLYDAPTPANTFQRVFTDNGVNTIVADSYYDPQILSLVANGNALNSLPAGLTNPAALVVGIAQNFRNARSFQAAASIEQQFTPKLSASMGYVRNSTWDLQRLVNTNLSSPTFDSAELPVFPIVRPNPAVGQSLLNESNAHSSYDGLLLTANWQFGRRSNLTANYTLSHSRDDASYFAPFGPMQALHPFALEADRADSNFDVRNNLNVSAIFNLPWGFKFNPLVVTHSGMPYTPILGFDTQNDGNDLNDRAVLNGKLAARNSLRQPAFFNLDVRLVKDITLPGEGHHLDLFMDIFNITGAANRNFGPYAVSLYGNPSSPVFSAGQPLFAPDTTRFGSARQIQFTARLVAF